MKIVFSRKGFDGGTGKVASPILPSGELCSLPIPEGLAGRHAVHYADLCYGEHGMGKLVCDLTRGRMRAEHLVHLDPDLNRESLGKAGRLPGWRPLFGQAGAAERHLQNAGVQAGDLFLFYGWFRRVELRSGMYRYVRDAPDLHVLFGWLQIERRVSVARREGIPDWARYHPHCRRAQLSTLDSLYIAAEKLNLPEVSMKVRAAGAGVFRRYRPSLCLTNTDPYRSRRLWRLPEWMYPTEGKTPLTYHARQEAWGRESGYTLLRTAGRGQEFVLDCEEYPQAVEWAGSVIGEALSC